LPIVHSIPNTPSGVDVTSEEAAGELCNRRVPEEGPPSGTDTVRKALCGARPAGPTFV